MEPLNIPTCPCNQDESEKPTQQPPQREFHPALLIALLPVTIIVWFLIYFQLGALADFVTYTMIGLTPQTHLGEAVRFFI